MQKEGKKYDDSPFFFLEILKRKPSKNFIETTNLLPVLLWTPFGI